MNICKMGTICLYLLQVANFTNVKKLAGFSNLSTLQM